VGLSLAAPELTPTQREMDSRDWTFGGTWPYEPRWLFTDGVRIHYVDEGPRDARAVMLVHGVPLWAYVFRDEIGAIAAGGRRVVAYDQLGFGRSDKPTREAEYSLEQDVAHLEALVDELELAGVEIVVQRSGVPIVRRFAARRPEEVVSVEERDEPALPELARVPLLGRLLVKGARLPVRRMKLSDVERAAYLAPHPSWDSRCGLVAALRREGSR
jgi:haloalkane dehalogenase